MVEEKLNKKQRDDGEIKRLEDELKTTKYNKKTQHHIGLVKAKLAKLKEKKEKRGSGGKKGEGFAVRRTGDGTVVLLGFPSVGKSTLLNTLTNADSDVGHYAFTTLTCIPGLLDYKHAKIQILDVPGIVEGAAAGTGRGKEVLQVIRTADLVLIVLDVFSPEHYNAILKEVYDSHVRLDKQKPDVKITKTSRGGIRVGKTVPLTMTDETIVAILQEFKLNNCEILIRTPITEDELIDVIEGNKKYVPRVVIANKVDMATKEDIARLEKVVKPDLYISAQKKLHIDELKELIFGKMGFIRIYLKEVNKKADMEVPLIMFKDCTVSDVCSKLHKDFVTKFRYARLWGNSVEFDGLKTQNKGHVLQDGDILELHMR